MDQRGAPAGAASARPWRDRVAPRRGRPGAAWTRAASEL